MDINIEDKRKEILSNIREVYKDSNSYGKLMDLLNNNRDISSLLKSDAIVYVLMESNRGYDKFYNELDKYQKIHHLYNMYALYFLGSKVVYPTLELVKDDYNSYYNILNDGKILYNKYLGEEVENKR